MNKPLRKSINPISPKKLLLSKWTAVTPVQREKHFIVVKLIESELPNSSTSMNNKAPLNLRAIHLEAIYSKRIYEMPWQDLQDSTQWLRGWK